MPLTVNQARRLIQEDDAFLERAVVIVYDRQHEHEKGSRSKADRSIYRNGFGLSAADASRISYNARWVLSGRHLTGWHLEEARRRMLKYSAQVADALERMERARLRRARQAA